VADNRVCHLDSTLADLPVERPRAGLLGAWAGCLGVCLLGLAVGCLLAVWAVRVVRVAQGRRWVQHLRVDKAVWAGL